MHYSGFMMFFAFLPLNTQLYVCYMCLVSMKFTTYKNGEEEGVFEQKNRIIAIKLSHCLRDVLEKKNNNQKNAIIKFEVKKQLFYRICGGWYCNLPGKWLFENDEFGCQHIPCWMGRRKFIKKWDQKEWFFLPSNRFCHWTFVCWDQIKKKKTWNKKYHK